MIMNVVIQLFNTCTRGDSTVVVDSPHLPEVKGSSPSTTIATGMEEIAKNIKILSPQLILSTMLIISDFNCYLTTFYCCFII
jgi:hypothetical protein